MRIRWLKENVGTGLEGVIAEIGEIIDHPLPEEARRLILHGAAEEVDLPPTQAPGAGDQYDAPSGKLTDVSGIGQIHAAQLARNGIASIGELAAAAVEDAAKAAGGISESTVKKWIEEAKQLVAPQEAA